ncbi:PilL N-terminal domain-containing protein [Hafnia paralvei]|uniref:PFGI-1 class ICE element type IV pilus protein PilL2 n=1 Tax=Hafnia paralvei TaxID=546367 RepID=UPI002032F698|nr:PilL N-terminal domain-containing protein [Hafnia paralvei]
MKCATIIALATTVILSGCSQGDRSQPVIEPICDNCSSAPYEAIRNGQYTLVTISPTAAQRFPLKQIITYTIPKQTNSTLREAIQYILKDTGYSLCVPDSQAEILFQHPLPAIHRSMGPIRLHQALVVLVGPAWEVKVNDTSRTVCPTLKAV